MNKRFWNKRTVSNMSDRMLQMWIDKCEELMGRSRDLGMEIAESTQEIHNLLMSEKSRRGWA
jgi:hypothetical protein